MCCQGKRDSTGLVRPGASTSTTCSWRKNSSKPPRKWPRDFTTTTRAAAMSRPNASKNTGSAHCTRLEITTTVMPSSCKRRATGRGRACCWRRCRAGRASCRRAGRRTTAGALNGLENSSPPSRLKCAVKLAPSPRRMRLGGQRRIVDHAHQRVPHAGLVERLEDPHRVAAPAAAGIVGDVGEDQRRAGRGPPCLCASRAASSSGVSVGRNRSRRAQPASAISRASACAASGVGRGDHDGQAVERRVGIGEAAHHRDVQHAPGIGRLAHALLAEVDHLAVRAVRARPCRSAC